MEVPEGVPVRTTLGSPRRGTSYARPEVGEWGTAPPYMNEGTTLGGYQILGFIGSGGMAEVYRARQISLGRDVALKILTTTGPQGKELEARFRREMQIHTKLDHPNLVQIIDAGVDQGHRFLAMELIEGPTLRDYIEEHSPLPVESALPMWRLISDAVFYVHSKGIIHRDLKPGNVLLADDNQPKLSDFGLAKSEYLTAMTQDRQLLGSVKYLAPEIVNGKEATPASDIYALGLILYEMLTKDLPYTASDFSDWMYVIRNSPPRPIRSLIPGVSKELSSLVARLLSKHPDSRPSAEELSQPLEDLLDEMEALRREERPTLGVSPRSADCRGPLQGELPATDRAPGSSSHKRVLENKGMTLKAMPPVDISEASVSTSLIRLKPKSFRILCGLGAVLLVLVVLAVRSTVVTIRTLRVDVSPQEFSLSAKLNRQGPLRLEWKIDNKVSNWNSAEVLVGPEDAQVTVPMKVDGWRFQSPLELRLLSGEAVLLSLRCPAITLDSCLGGFEHLKFVNVEPNLTDWTAAFTDEASTQKRLLVGRQSGGNVSFQGILPKESRRIWLRELKAMGSLPQRGSQVVPAQLTMNCSMFQWSRSARTPWVDAELRRWAKELKSKGRDTQTSLFCEGLGLGHKPYVDEDLKTAHEALQRFLRSPDINLEEKARVYAQLLDLAVAQVALIDQGATPKVDILEIMQSFVSAERKAPAPDQLQFQMDPVCLAIVSDVDPSVTKLGYDFLAQVYMRPMFLVPRHPSFPSRLAAAALAESWGVRRHITPRGSPKPNAKGRVGLRIAVHNLTRPRYLILRLEGRCLLEIPLFNPKNEWHVDNPLGGRLLHPTPLSWVNIPVTSGFYDISIPAALIVKDPPSLEISYHCLPGFTSATEHAVIVFDAEWLQT